MGNNEGEDKAMYMEQAMRLKRHLLSWQGRVGVDGTLSLDQQIEQETSAMKRHLLVRHFRTKFHGYSNVEQQMYFADLVRERGAKHVGEIGFNIGLSSLAFLLGSSDTTVVSFDRLAYSYNWTAEKRIRDRFPNRFELVAGDSRETVPWFAKERGPLFDIIYIDGGHDYEVAKADLWNMRDCAADGALIIMDDTIPWKAYGAGPTQAWLEAQAVGLVRQTAFLVDGEQRCQIEPPGERAWALGHYLRPPSC